MLVIGFIVFLVYCFFIAGVVRAAELGGLISDLNNMWFGSSPVIALLLTPFLIKHTSSAVKAIILLALSVTSQAAIKAASVLKG